MSAMLKLQNNSLKQMIKDVENYGKRSPKDRTKNYIKNRISTLEENFKMSTQYNNKGITVAEPEDVAKLEDIFEKIKELYYDYKASMQDALDKLEVVTESTVSTKLSNDSDKLKISLPKINIPIFSGDYNTWRSFHDIFDSLINSNKEFSDVEKLHYLKSSLRDEAERLLQHLPINEGNYKPAWEILISRYDHKRVLVNTQLKIFFDQETIRVESVAALKKLLDTSVECKHALQNLKLPVEHWDTVLIFSMVRKLPPVTQQLWEEKLGTDKELPKFKTFCDFLESRFRTLEAVKQQQDTKINKEVSVKKQSFLLKQTKKIQYSCKVCNKDAHALRKCSKFLKLDIASRKSWVNRIGVCQNCLAYSHDTAQCPSRIRCYSCQQLHHSLLHSNLTPHSSHTTNTQHHTIHTAPSTSTNNQHPHYNPTHAQSPHLNPNTLPFQQNHIQSLHTTQEIREVLLATAIVSIGSASGEKVNLRALFDPGSEASFISRHAANMLGISEKRTHVEVTGLGKVSSGTCYGYVDITLRSLQSEFETNVQALIFQSLTGLLPSHRVQAAKWSHIMGLPLADPTFYIPSEIDLILGNDVYAQVVLPQIVRDELEIGPIAQNTKFGWVVMGKTSQVCRSVKSFVQITDIDKQLRRFWEIEEAPFKTHQTDEEKACEIFFQATTKRLTNGRYEVSLPFRAGRKPALGPSKQGALRRFTHLERRFRDNKNLKIEYSQCIEEYLRLGHMTEVDMIQDEVLNSPYHYFLPHHAVFKEASSTTKLRVVFDAAAKTSDGTSLNQHLLTGPKTQTNIMDIILKWRKHKFTFTADIEKMYRQIRVGKDDSYYQLIFWRSDETQPIKLYRLQTVTFGTTCAPYLAIRSLNQLADDEGNMYPLGACMVKNDIYVDDLFAGADSVDEAVEKRHQVDNLLRAGGFTLRKWATNAVEILDGVPMDQREVDLSLPLSSLAQVKALGIKWFPGDDYLSFQNAQPDQSAPTKRNILSAISRLFDPLGWISPCVVKGKMIMQNLWISQVDWDEPIPMEMRKEWTTFSAELPQLEHIKVPRWINTHGTQKELQLHGFSDASQKAYGAVIYLRVLDQADKIHTHLVMAKTRVAPVKTQTLPRLELCGAALLATLLDYTARVLDIKEARQYAWSDSTITLAWIAAPPNKWTTFVCNRVAGIQQLVKPESWMHIPSEMNLADLASRGTTPSALQANTLWWKGPEFLRESWDFQYPSQPTSLRTEEEKRTVKVHAIRQVKNNISSLIFSHSNLGKLLRIVAYCQRFIANMRSSPEVRKWKPLSPKEIHSARVALLKVVQSEMFHGTEKFEVPKSLCPFTDTEGIMRVGGRLQNSELLYEQQHPIILRGNHHFTKLLVTEAHLNTLHGGLQLTLLYLRNNYWILKFKNVVKGVINRCIICYRQRAKAANQLMGNLPTPRVCISYPFSHTGVDYAGPIEIKTWKGRNAKKYKAYFAIFVCLATKAIHIEVVSDLTTDAFIAALRRFTARRGLCSQIFSDNGTNFVGANRELKRLLEEAKFDWAKVAETLAMDSIKWHFIPPASPHFGGLWEAGVKSIKHHLKRVSRAEVFTYEELTTLLHQIEACLNSRPLCPLSDDPQDFNVLTPGHFLIGRPLNAIPQPDSTKTSIGHLKHWHRIQHMQLLFWKKWQTEYLTRLQQRPKWLKVERQPKIGDLVLLKEDQLPPTKWSLARILETHAGDDKLIRVVTLRTPKGEIRRPITRICILPSNEHQEETTLEMENQTPMTHK